MTRRIVHVLTGFLLIIGMAAGALASSGVAAQEATPGAGQEGPPEQFEIAPGVTVDNMVFVEGQEAPPIYRLSFAPGVEYQVEPSEALELAYVERGSLVLELDTVIVVQVATANVSGSSVVFGGQISVSAGEYFVIPPETGGIVRNEADEPAVVSVAGIIPEAGASVEATPAG